MFNVKHIKILELNASQFYYTFRVLSHEIHIRGQNNRYKNVGVICKPMTLLKHVLFRMLHIKISYYIHQPVGNNIIYRYTPTYSFLIFPKVSGGVRFYSFRLCYM